MPPQPAQPEKDSTTATPIDGKMTKSQRRRSKKVIEKKEQRAAAVQASIGKPIVEAAKPVVQKQQPAKTGKKGGPAKPNRADRKLAAKEKSQARGSWKTEAP